MLDWPPHFCWWTFCFMTFLQHTFIWSKSEWPKHDLIKTLHEKDVSVCLLTKMQSANYNHGSGSKRNGSWEFAAKCISATNGRSKCNHDNYGLNERICVFELCILHIHRQIKRDVHNISTKIHVHYKNLFVWSLLTTYPPTSWGKTAVPDIMCCMSTDRMSSKRPSSSTTGTLSVQWCH